jgi:hypothetical protein
MTKPEAVLFFTDLITIFAWTALHAEPIRQVATSVIAPFLPHKHRQFNRK